jgi:hypothetical protein
MQRIALITRFVTFCVFFFAGAGAMVLAIIAEPELVDYYRSRDTLVKVQKQNEQLQSLISRYNAQIAMIESEPELLKRFSPAAFNRKPAAPDTLFPEVRNSDLRSETEKIIELINAPVTADPIPLWLQRVLEPKLRKSLFLSGAALVLVTFIFFGTPRGKFLIRV